MDFDPLLPYLPEGDFIPLLKKWLEHEKFELILHRPRATKLGDFRPPRKGNIAKITLNSNLGPYQFLTTLTHEIAHLKVWNAHARRAAPHGLEWKTVFGEMLQELAHYQTWPETYLAALLKHAIRPKSSVGADPDLQKVILQLDHNSDVFLLQDVPNGGNFLFKGRAFKRLEKRRTRALVFEISSGMKYTIPLVAQVELKD